MSRTSLCLEYGGVNAEWEARELRAFSANGAIRPATAVSNYLLGRLLEADLHVSCKPMLPANVQEMKGSMLQGVCLLQVVDIVNIGANFESRTDDSKGPTRTLKLCLTDGHQTVFGFEYKWLPKLSVKTPRGTKIVVQNVAVRHGMLLLTPETCYIIGASGNDELDVAKLHSSLSETTSSTRPAGAYSAAVVTVSADLNSASIPSTPRASTSTPQGLVREPTALPSAPPAVSMTRVPQRIPAPRPAGLRPREDHLMEQKPEPVHTAHSVFSPPRAKPEGVNPPVFVDISSDEDGSAASDATDPMVEHLFYSPNTPRIQEASALSRQNAPSRKRPHPDSNRSSSRTVPATAAGIPTIPPQKQHSVVDMTASPAPKDKDPFKMETAFSLLSSMSVIPKEKPRTTIDATAPFLYFRSRLAPLDQRAKPTQVGSVLMIRGFMKSVAGFQFNTGVFHLRVLIEDCTATQEVQVDPVLVESLMGVSCTEFAQAMQRTPTVAHRLAAKMQVALMTMQGIMRLRLDTIPDRYTLLECRPYTSDEAHALLDRVRYHLRGY